MHKGPFAWSACGAGRPRGCLRRPVELPRADGRAFIFSCVFVAFVPLVADRVLRLCELPASEVDRVISVILLTANLGVSVSR